MQDKVKLFPVGMIHSIFIGDDFISDWMVFRKFEYSNKQFNVRGFGRTKDEAMADYEYELQEIEDEI